MDFFVPPHMARVARLLLLLHIWSNNRNFWEHMCKNGHNQRADEQHAIVVAGQTAALLADAVAISS